MGLQRNRNHHSAIRAAAAMKNLLSKELKSKCTPKVFQDQQKVNHSDSDTSLHKPTLWNTVQGTSPRKGANNKIRQPLKVTDFVRKPKSSKGNRQLISNQMSDNRSNSLVKLCLPSCKYRGRNCAEVLPLYEVDASYGMLWRQ